MHRHFLLLVISTLLPGQALALTYVRESTIAESNFRDSLDHGLGSTPCEESLAFRLQCQGQWVAEDAIWQTRNVGTILSESLQTTGGEEQIVFSPEEEISIVTTLIDYSRTDLVIDFFDEGTDLQLHGQGMTYALQTTEFRFPEDVFKELVFPIGQLAPGNYSLTVLSEVTTIGGLIAVPSGTNGDLVLEFTNDSWTRQTSELISFTVVPEPSSLAYVGISCFIGLARGLLPRRIRN